jgi:hypothetical protein
MSDSQDDDHMIDDADEREQMTAAIVAGLFGEAELKAFLAKAPYADAETLFTDLHRTAVDKVAKLSEEDRAELVADLFGELNWNYIINLLLNDAAEVGLFEEGKTRLLEGEEQS